MPAAKQSFPNFANRMLLFLLCPQKNNLNRLALRRKTCCVTYVAEVDFFGIVIHYNFQINRTHG
jgi:hypothetical protein